MRDAGPPTSFEEALAASDRELAYLRGKLGPLLESVRGIVTSCESFDEECCQEEHAPCVPAFQRAIRGAERAVRYHDTRLVPILSSLLSLEDDEDDEEPLLLPLSPPALRAGG